MTVEITEDARLIELTVNGTTRRGVAEPRTLLSDFIRHELKLTGTHVGCEQGECGACTVRVDGALTRSCVTLALQAEGAHVETIEGVTGGPPHGALHPIQEAFRECHGLQCGFCTPAMVLSTQALLEHHPDPSEQEIRTFLAGTICRCTGYTGIVESVQEAARRARPASVRPGRRDDRHAEACDAR